MAFSASVSSTSQSCCASKDSHLESFALSLDGHATLFLVPSASVTLHLERTPGAPPLDASHYVDMWALKELLRRVTRSLGLSAGVGEFTKLPKVGDEVARLTVSTASREAATKVVSLTNSKTLTLKGIPGLLVLRSQVDVSPPFDRLQKEWRAYLEHTGAGENHREVDNSLLNRLPSRPARSWEEMWASLPVGHRPDTLTLAFLPVSWFVSPGSSKYDNGSESIARILRSHWPSIDAVDVFPLSEDPFSFAFGSLPFDGGGGTPLAPGHEFGVPPSSAPHSLLEYDVDGWDARDDDLTLHPAHRKRFLGLASRLSHGRSGGGSGSRPGLVASPGGELPVREVRRSSEADLSLSELTAALTVDASFLGPKMVSRLGSVVVYVRFGCLGEFESAAATFSRLNAIVRGSPSLSSSLSKSWPRAPPTTTTTTATTTATAGEGAPLPPPSSSARASASDTMPSLDDDESEAMRRPSLSSSSCSVSSLASLSTPSESDGSETPLMVEKVVPCPLHVPPTTTTATTTTTTGAAATTTTTTSTTTAATSTSSSSSAAAATFTNPAPTLPVSLWIGWDASGVMSREGVEGRRRAVLERVAREEEEERRRVEAEEAQRAADEARLRREAEERAAKEVADRERAELEERRKKEAEAADLLRRAEEEARQRAYLLALAREREEEKERRRAATQERKEQERRALLIAAAEERASRERLAKEDLLKDAQGQVAAWTAALESTRVRLSELEQELAKRRRRSSSQSAHHQRRPGKRAREEATTESEEGSGGDDGDSKGDDDDQKKAEAPSNGATGQTESEGEGHSTARRRRRRLHQSSAPPATGLEVEADLRKRALAALLSVNKKRAPVV